MSFSICVCGGNAYELAVLGHLNFSMKKKHGPETHEACYCSLTSHAYVVQPKQDVHSLFFCWLAQPFIVCHLNIEDTK